MADEIKIRVAADISQLQSQMADGASAVEQFGVKASDVLGRYQEAMAGSERQQQAFKASIQILQSQGFSWAEAVNEASIALQEYAVAAAEAAAAPPPAAAAGGAAPTGNPDLQREVAAATLEQVEARKALNEIVAESIKYELEDEATLDAVAAAQQRLIAASEALATAKKNLAESAQFDALAEDSETAGSDILAAAEAQLAEATLAAKAAKTELNSVIGQFAGRTDAEAIALVAQAQRNETEATEQLLLAKQNLAEVREYEANAARTEAEVINQNTNAQVRNAESMTASRTAAMLLGRELGGGLGYQLGRIAGQSSTLGPLLSLAFPVIGALALTQIVVQLGTELYDVATKATQAGEEIARGFDEANQKIEAGNDALELENSKLQDQIDKLEGKPSNGLQTAMLEAIALADRLQAALAGDSRELESLLKKREVGYFGAALTATVPTVGLDKSLIQQSDEIESKSYQILQTYRQEMHEAVGDKEKTAEAQKRYFDTINGLYDNEITTLKPKLDHYYELQRENNEKIAVMHRLHIPTSIFTSQDVDYSPAVNALERQLRQLDDLKRRAQDISEITPKQEKKGELDQHKGDESAANKARQQKLEALETEYEEEVAIEGKSAYSAAAYWSQYLNTFEVGTTQFKAVLAKYNQAVEQYGKKEPSGDLFGKLHEQIKKNNAELKKDADEYQRILDTFPEGERKMQEEMAKQATLQLTQTHEQTLGTLELSHAQQESPYNIGTQSDAGKQLADLKKFHDQVLAENESFVRKEIALAQGAGETDKAQELQNKLTEIQRKGDLQRLADQEAILKEQLADYVKVYDTITADLNSSIEKLVTTTQRPAQIFAQMFDHMLGQLAQFSAQWLEKQALMWAKTELLQILGKTQQQTTQTAAATAQTAQLTTTTAAQTSIITTAQTAQTAAVTAAQTAQVTAITTAQTAETAALVAGHAAQSATNVATVAADAAVAAANTMAWWTAVNPPIAPAMAAAAYAETLAFGSLAAFEQGGIVAGMTGMPVPIMAHAGERVLTTSQTHNFERMVNQSTQAVNSFHLHYNGQVSAYDRSGMRSTLQAHAGDILEIVREGWNAGKIR